MELMTSPGFYRPSYPAFLLAWGEYRVLKQRGRFSLFLSHQAIATFCRDNDVIMHSRRK